MAKLALTSRKAVEAAPRMAQSKPPSALTNDQILLLGATALGTIRTGYPKRKSYDPAQVAYAEDWLQYWAIAAKMAKTRREFIEVMAFLMYP